MKIIQITSFYKPNVGGVEKQVEHISSHLKQSGFDVEIFTTDATHGSSSRIKSNGSDNNDIIVRRFRYLFGFGSFFRFAPTLLLKLARSKFDIVHIHNTHDAHFIGTIIIAKLKRKKIVLTGHNPYIVDSQKRGNLLNKLVHSYDYVLKIFLPFVDKYIALLFSEKQYVQTFFRISGNKISLIPNGINEIFYTQETKRNNESLIKELGINRSKYKMVVGTASRMNFVKGIHNLKMAADTLPDVQFVFVGGDGGYLNDIKKLYQDNTNVIIFDRYIPQERLVDFYDEIDLFLLPSLYEPFGMTLVEAMARGKFILSTNVGGTQEIIKPEYGELLDPKNHKLWAERIGYYKEHTDLLKLNKYAQKEAEKYKWDVVMGKLIEVYEGLF